MELIETWVLIGALIGLMIVLSGMVIYNRKATQKKNGFTKPEPSFQKNQSVVCGKCGTDNPNNEKQCLECGDYLHQYKVESQSTKCPNCSEKISPTATICPHCKQAIFSHNKQTNAIVGVFVFIILFVVFYFFITLFVDFEANRIMDGITIP